MRNLFRAVGLTAAVTGILLASAVPSNAASTRPIQTGVVSITGVSGPLHAGATISVVQVCPTGTKIAREVTRGAGQLHTGGVRVASRELWPAGMVTRFRVVREMHAEDSALLFTALACKMRVAGSTTLVRGRATVDVRLWGPADSRVVLLNAVTLVVASNLLTGTDYATTMKAVGVNSNHASVQHAVRAMQAEFNEAGSGLVIAAGETRKAVARGTFASMQSHFRFRGHLDRELWVS